MRRRGRGRNRRGRGRNAMPVRVSGQAESRVEQGDELLPGIPNELTVNLIALKLPWTTFYVLSLVSHGWRRTIRSREVHDARVRSKSTQTLVAVGGHFLNASTIALYSLEDGSWYNLPPIPYIKGPMEGSWECVFLDGKLYAMGGHREYNIVEDTYADLYVFDLACQRQWQKCASMENPRYAFGCGIKDGKIYVFGGLGGRFGGLILVEESEVYDPKEDAWSPIKPDPSVRFHHKVAIMGEEVVLLGGLYYNTSELVNREYRDRCPKDAYFADVYHPPKNEWRIVENLTQNIGDIALVVGDNLYRLSGSGIQVYDIAANSWSPLQPISFGVPDRGYTFFPPVVAAVGVDDEVLAMMKMARDEDEDEEGLRKVEYGLIRSQGVGAKNTDITWQVLLYPMSSNVSGEFMCPVHL